VQAAAGRADARVIVVGRNPPAALIDAARRRNLAWTFTGFVDDVRPFIQVAQISVVPLRVGRPEQVDTHHLRNAARIVAVALVDLGFEKGLGVPGLDADNRQSGLHHSAEQPLRQSTGFKPDTLIRQAGSLSTCTRSSGWLSTFTSRQMLPASFTTQTDVSLTETSRPA
jgi:hypothetical protein